MLKGYRQIANTKWFDVVVASPLMVFYAFAIFGMVVRALPDLRGLAAHMDGTRALSIVSQFVTMVFFGVQIALFVIRRVPLAKASGIWPRAAAIVGSNLQIAFLLVPRIEYGATVRIVSLLLIIAGTATSIGVVCFLGKSFSILPQARSLTMSGPYRFVRHPLYLTEQIATLGVMFQFAAPWSFLIATASFATQFPRMHYEEEILSASFPAYRDYVKRTARLIPGIY